MSKIDDYNDVIRRIDANLSAIKKLIEIQLRGAISEELEKIASTIERKKIWSLCDGTMNVSDIAKEVGISKRAVHYFIEDAQKAELIRTDKKGFPFRNLDWIPPEWKEDLKKVPKTQCSNEDIINEGSSK